MKYVVVENAGYEMEFTWPVKFANAEKALRFVSRKYKPDEVAKLHVLVAILKDGQVSYDL